MLLSIITINYNNAAGLEKTLRSVAAQSCKDFEHVIVDGGSTDGSVATIQEYVGNQRQTIKWVSEKDSGIYNAMNKGIRMATGDYIQILNSGDCLASADVVERMLKALEANGFPEILYGNMIKVWPDGHRVNDRCGGKAEKAVLKAEPTSLTMLSFYHGTLNHDSAYIKRSLFDRFGLYDEQLKIVSDWKWYLKAIPLGGVVPYYVDIDVTLFDMTGVSESNPEFWKVERRPVLEAEVPAMILKDYDCYHEAMGVYDRLKRHHLWKGVRFVERVLFKLEKWGVLK